MKHKPSYMFQQQTTINQVDINKNEVLFIIVSQRWRFLLKYVGEFMFVDDL